jgi:hypothetical protein
MRNMIGSILIFVAALFHQSEAQPYWVVETNLRQRSFTIIRFYNARHELIYEQKEIGQYFNASKKKHQRQLDLMLENYLRYGSPVAKKETKRRSEKGF